VPVSAIKYYTREGMLPAGERTSPNQVAYSDEHVRRLRLIRAMLEVGGMSVAGAREVLAVVDMPGAGVNEMFGRAQEALGRPVERRSADSSSVEDRQLAEREVDELLKRHGWHDESLSRAQDQSSAGLAQVVAAYRALGQNELLTLLDSYADAAARLAAAELDVIAALPTTDSKVEGVVLGTVLGDAAMAALRRIAQKDTSQRLLEG